MHEYPNIVIKSHYGPTEVNFTVYAGEEIEIIMKNIQALPYDKRFKYIEGEAKRFLERHNELSAALKSDQTEYDPDLYRAELGYVKSVLGYLKNQFNIYDDVPVNKNNPDLKIASVDHILKKSANKFEINHQIMLVQIFRLIYCLNLENKFVRKLLNKEMIDIFIANFTWKNEIKSKTLMTYLKSFDTEVKRERNKLSKDLNNIDEGSVIEIVNSLIHL